VTTPPPPPPPVGAPPPIAVPYQPSPARRTNGFAVASLVLGIVSFFCVGFLFPVPLLAVIFGHLALERIARSGGALGGRGLAIAGAILGWIFLVPPVIATFVWVGYGISNL
jgi:hypothetical protein